MALGDLSFESVVAAVAAVAAVGEGVDDDGCGCCWRTRSPRMTTSCWMTDLPASTMCGVPCRRARREILLPVSCGREELESEMRNEKLGKGWCELGAYSLNVFAASGAFGRHTEWQHTRSCSLKGVTTTPALRGTLNHLLLLYQWRTIRVYLRVSRRGRCPGSCDIKAHSADHAEDFSQLHSSVIDISNLSVVHSLSDIS